MHIISKTKLKEFFAVHPEAESKLNAWFRTLEHNSATSFKDLKQTFATAD
jgi:mRNA interferase HigB